MRDPSRKTFHYPQPNNSLHRSPAKAPTTPKYPVQVPVDAFLEVSLLLASASTIVTITTSMMLGSRHAYFDCGRSIYLRICRHLKCGWLPCIGPRRIIGVATGTVEVHIGRLHGAMMAGAWLPIKEDLTRIRRAIGPGRVKILYPWCVGVI